MKKIRTWELCRTGTFGQDGARITEQDLKEAAETFCPTRPISIGHETARSDNFPKFGDILVIDGIYDDSKHPGEKVLVGQVVLHPALEEQFDDGADGAGVYKGWSVTLPRRAVDGKRYLHSLAICGATPPKIPGLEELMTKVCYSDGDAIEVFNFSDNLTYTYQEASAMTDEEKKKMEALEAENKRLKEEAEKAKAKELSDPAPDGQPPAAKAKQEAEFADMKSRCERLEHEARTARIEGVMNKLDGKIPKGLVAKARSLASAFADAGECEFSDEDETKKMAALDLFADVLAGCCQMDPLITQQVYRAADETFSDGQIDFADLANKM